MLSFGEIKHHGLFGSQRPKGQPCTKVALEEELKGSADHPKSEVGSTSIFPPVNGEPKSTPPSFPAVSQLQMTMTLV